MKHLRSLGFILCACALQEARADGLVIDKVYHPYVDALERELEYRALPQDKAGGPDQVHMLSLGSSIGQGLFLEAYAIGEKSGAGGFAIAAWETELKWQLTDQGEYRADWGLLFEYENERGVDVEEATVALLAEKEWGRWSGAANFHLINEWGDDIDPEIESVLATQLRYRYAQAFEPGIEFYAGQDTLALGPVLQGTLNTGVRKALHWEAGYLVGLDAETADGTWRFLFEFEF